MGPCGRALVLGGLLLLPACASLPGLGQDQEDTAGVASSAAASPSSTDVEAPELFQVTEAGLWDGRPSLGGVWVAHPDVSEPERVRIVNTDNGQEVVGALFRRERDLPGPALQVSSDAAEALGMLAGAPADLRVTALRRTEAPADPAPPVAEEDAAVPAAEAPAQTSGAATAGSRVAEATAAILAGGAAPAAVATTALDAPASPLRYPFVQLSAGADRAGAEAEAEALVARGLPARVAQGASGVWRVLLGPAATEAEQTALRARAVAEGYPEAYLVQS